MAWSVNLVEVENRATNQQSTVPSAMMEKLHALDAKVEATATRTQDILRARTDALGLSISRVFYVVKDELLTVVSDVIHEEMQLLQSSLQVDIRETVNSVIKAYEVEMLEDHLRHLKDSSTSML